jgi:uncharacterized protein
MQPTPFCNLDCTYCYLPGRDDKRRLDISTVEATLRNILDSGLLGPELTVIWHAGEPLVVPPRFYAEAFERIATLVGDRTAVSHSIQTNGTLIDDAWCDLFRTWSVRVGISLDGPAPLHDRHRKTRSGRGTHRNVMRGVRRMIQAGLPFYVIAVVTADALDEPDAILDFFQESGIRDIALNVEEQEGINPCSSLAGAEDRVSAFYRRVFERVATSDGRLRVREFDQARDAILRGLPGFKIGEKRYVSNEQFRPLEITTVDCEGNFSTFSPELLGQTHQRFDGFALGNVHRDRLIDVLGTPRFRELFGAILAGVEQCARDCPYYLLCGGGAPANKLFENGRFDSTETAFCRNAIQRPLDVALEVLESIANKAGMVPSSPTQSSGYLAAAAVKPQSDGAS